MRSWFPWETTKFSFSIAQLENPICDARPPTWNSRFLNVNCQGKEFQVFNIDSSLIHNRSNIHQSIVLFIGPGLVFVVYPEGIAQMPISPLWAFLFFFMILTIGLDTQFAMFEAVITGLSDEYPKHLRKYKALFTGFACFICFLLGLPLVTQVIYQPIFTLILKFFWRGGVLKINKLFDMKINKHGHNIWQCVSFTSVRILHGGIFKICKIAVHMSRPCWMKCILWQSPPFLFRLPWYQNKETKNNSVMKFCCLLSFFSMNTTVRIRNLNTVETVNKGTKQGMIEKHFSSLWISLHEFF